MAPLHAVLAAASLALLVSPALASADPEPFCRLHWEKPVVHTDENGVPHHVEVERPRWIC